MGTNPKYLCSPSLTLRPLSFPNTGSTWERVQDLGRRVHGRLCPRLTCAVLWVPIRYLMPAPRVLLPINVMPFETRFKAFVRMTTPGLKPLFGRWVFYIRWCAWFWAMLAFCTMATYVRPCPWTPLSTDVSAVSPPLHNRRLPLKVGGSYSFFVPPHAGVMEAS